MPKNSKKKLGADVRATNIVSSMANISEVRDFHFTPKSVDALAQIVDGLETGARQRAWEIVGPYGSGKSTFGLFLLNAFGSTPSKWLINALESLKLQDESMASTIHRKIDASPGTYVSVAIEGNRYSLELALAKALLGAAIKQESTLSWAPEAFVDSLTRTIEGIEAGLNDPQGVLDHYRQAIGLVKIAGRRGVLVVIDEFGKFLEHAAWQGDTPDVIVAQYLAELASSSAEPDLLLAVLVHQSFQHYASGLNEQQWIEWTKVQGRFTQIDFSEDPENLYSLIAEEIDLLPPSGQWGEDLWSKIEGTGPFTSEQDYWANLFQSTYPLHPYSLYALPRMSALLGQHERTLATFLSTDGPFGLRAFSAMKPPDKATAFPLYRLLDYFLEDVRFTALPPDVQRRVSELNVALNRVDPDSLEGLVAKTIAAMALLGTQSSLRPVRTVITAALSADQSLTESLVNQTIDDLISSRTIVFREFNNEFQLWQGSDFDIEASIVKQKTLMHHDSVAPAFSRLVNARPMIARRHSIETGALRWFQPVYMSASEFLKCDDTQLMFDELEEKSDGILAMTLPGTKQELSAVREHALSLADPRVVVSIPKEPTQLLQFALDLDALKLVAATSTELTGDPVAQGEISARITAMQQMLHEANTSLFEPSLNKADWISIGENKGITSGLALNRLLSDISDQLYSCTPLIPNEQINRSKLSTSSTSAARKIAIGLLDNKGAENLGFEGQGPEVGIFRSMFVDTGIYAQQSQTGKYRLTKVTKKDPRGISQTWAAIERFISSTVSVPRSINTIMETLSHPPYGIKNGLMPLLIWSVLVYHKDKVCLFDDGEYLADWTEEDFDRFARDPRSFSVRSLVMRGSLGALIRELNSAFKNGNPIPKSTSVPLPIFLANAFRWYRSLPDYAKNTASVSAESREIIRSFMNAHDPAELVLTSIPTALGMTFDDSEVSEEQIEKYRNKFTEAVKELNKAYEMLREQIASNMKEAIDLTESSEFSELRIQVKSLYDEIGDYVRDPAVKAFLLRGSDEKLTDLQWIESTSSALAAQSPRFWYDRHVEEFQDKLATAALVIKDAKRTAFANQISSGSGSTLRVHVQSNDKEPAEFFFDTKEISPDDGWAYRVLDHLAFIASGMSEAERQKVLAMALGIVVNRTKPIEVENE